jgi:hypothetical protein
VQVGQTAHRPWQEGMRAAERPIGWLVRRGSFNPKADEGITEVWRLEAESRIDAFDADEHTDGSTEAVFARINRDPEA